MLTRKVRVIAQITDQQAGEVDLQEGVLGDVLEAFMVVKVALPHPPPEADEDNDLVVS